MKRLLILPAAALLLLAACGDSGEGGDLNVTLTEWEVAANKDSLEKGPIVIDVDNEGDREHELVIVTTDIPLDELPTKDDGSFDEDAPGVDIKEEIEDIEDGDSTSRTYEFDEGSYIFLCNIVEDIDGTETSHFAQGMATAFTVGDGSETNSPEDDESATEEAADEATATP